MIISNLAVFGRRKDVENSDPVSKLLVTPAFISHLGHLEGIFQTYEPSRNSALFFLFGG